MLLDRSREEEAERDFAEARRRHAAAAADYLDKVGLRGPENPRLQ